MFAPCKQLTFTIKEYEPNVLTSSESNRWNEAEDFFGDLLKFSLKNRNNTKHLIMLFKMSRLSDVKHTNYPSPPFSVQTKRCTAGKVKCVCMLLQYLLPPLRRICVLFKYKNNKKRFQCKLKTMYSWKKEDEQTIGSVGVDIAWEYNYAQECKGIN